MPSPIALSFTPLPGHDPADPATLAHPVIEVDTIVHPQLAKLLDRTGATRRGRSAWAYHPGEGGDHTPLSTLLTSDFGANVLPAGACVTQSGRPARISPYEWASATVLDTLRGTLAASPGALRTLTALTNAALRRRGGYHHQGEYFPHGNDGLGLIAVSADQRGTVWLRVHTHAFQLTPEHHAAAEQCGIDRRLGNLDLRPAGRAARDPKRVSGYDAVRLAEWARRESFPIADNPQFALHLRDRDDVVAAAKRLHVNGGPAAVLSDAELVMAARASRRPHTVLGVDKGDYTAALGRITSVASQLRATATTSCVVLPQRGAPAQAVATVGSRFSGLSLVGGKRRRRDAAPGLPAATQTPTSLQIAKVSGLDPAIAYVDPQLLDVANMDEAVPFEDPLLRPYQRLIVGRHLATRRGFVNCIEPGMGKTVTTLTAWSERARRIPGWRGLAVVEANVRGQWAGEVERWFPEAVVVVVRSRADRDTLAQTLADAGDTPVLVVTSYALIATVGDAVAAHEAVARTSRRAQQARAALRAGAKNRRLTVEERDELLANVADAMAAAREARAQVPDPDTHLGALLATCRWHDLAADEVVGLRNTGAKAGKALWAIRERSEVAVALTGTPITRGIDDLGALVCWTRGDRTLFSGALLSDSFDLTSDADLARFTAALGPLLVRFDKSEIADELPSVTSEVVKLVPTLSERRLAHAARDELKAAYEELVGALELARQSDPDDPELAELAQQIRSLRAAWLGGTTLARMAASDPAALESSNTSAAALLSTQGLIEAAMADGGTKRRWASEYIRNEVASGRRVLVFTEFQTVARLLLAELADHGLAVGAILGGGGARRDADVAAFQRGELDVMVSTKAGERGLNLQVADTVLHLDLPWTPDGVVQRTGRVERIGASSSQVKLAFAVMTTTIEDRIAALVVARSLTAMRALDASRGKGAGATEMGRALVGLADGVDVSASGLKGKEAQMLELTRELLAA